MIDFIKGMDISSLLEIEKLGGRYFDHGEEIDLLTLLQNYGVNSIRLRLWHNPYALSGDAYGAGTNDLPATIALAKRVIAKKIGFLLDLHYSDFWTDPGKQFVPKAWEGFSEKELEEAVYTYTKEVMEKLKEEGALPTMVQVGNEVSNGLLWPYGKVPNYDTIAKFINAGIRGVRSVDRNVPIMIHLDRGNDNALYREWFDHFMEKGEDFQIIGMSYYPIWNGPLEGLEANMNDVAARYGKDIIIAEVSTGFTMEDYADYEKLPSSERKGYASKPSLVEKMEYPMTIEGQCEFLKDFLNRLNRVTDGKGKGFYYWEPAWIPVPGSGWATKASLEYIKDPGPCGNEWANQALVDYEGNALPALQVIKDFKLNP